MFRFTWIFLIFSLINLVQTVNNSDPPQLGNDSLENVISMYKSKKLDDAFVSDQPYDDDEWERLVAKKSDRVNLVAEEAIDSDLASLLSYAESPDYTDEDNSSSPKLEGPNYDEIFEVDVPDSEETTTQNIIENTTFKPDNPEDNTIDILKGSSLERPKEIFLDDLLQENFNMSAAIGEASQNPQKHQSSLSFVFDSTGSMWDDLQQLKEGAEKIMYAMKEREDQPIYNYILVPFHDPKVGPVTVTRDYEVFLDKLDEIVVYGGGDCPEMSLGGIRKALEASLPQSYIYVLTDATAGDHFLVDDILNELQRKEIQVVFILTGDCGSRTVPEYKVYEQIAEASSGQVFHLKKSDVNQVLDFVRTTLDSRRVGLYSVSKIKASNTKPHNVDVDESLRELMVTIAGDNPHVEFTNPNGEIVYEPPKVNEILTLENIKVVNVVEPEAGRWAVSIKSDSDHDIRLTGLSELKFEHGFAVQPTGSMDETSHRPLQSSKNYLIVKPSTDLEAGNITQVVLTGLDGQPMKELPMKKINDAYTSEAILIPPYFFNLLINGFDSQGNYFQRTTTTAIKPQPPEKPFIEMQSSLLHPMHKPLNISCHVQSLVPITQQWYKNDRPIGDINEKEQSGTFYWTDPYPTSHTSGIFKCQASNIAGITEAALDLQISEPPILKKIERSILYLNRGNAVELPCYTLAGLPPPETTWLVNNSELKTENGIAILYNRSLAIESVSDKHAGVYKCIATNLAGIDFYTIEIRMNIEPKIKTSSVEKYQKIVGEKLELNCEVSGDPKPKVTWTKNGDAFQNKILTSNVLNIDSLVKTDAGIYTCIASNPAGTAKKNFEIVVKIVPEILKIGDENLATFEGELVSLACPILSDSEPEIIWFWNSMELNFDDKFLDDSNTLRFVANRNDNGEFECQALTPEGKALRKWNLNVYVHPIIFDPSKEIVRTTLNASTNLVCEFDGFPVPTSVWYKDASKIFNDFHFRVNKPKETKTILTISKIKSEFAGDYICGIDNSLGITNKTFQVIVDAPPIITEFPDTNISVLYGQNLSVSCQVEGSPKPYVLWTKNSKIIRQKDIFLEENNTLRIQFATEDANGIYRCIAANSKGVAKQEFSVRVLIPPQSLNSENPTLLEVQEGDSVQLECPHSKMFPPPKIIWKKENEEIFSDSREIFRSFERNRLKIFAVQISDGGTYECIVSNAVGSTSYQTILSVLYAPMFTNKIDEVLTQKIGQELHLECQVIGNPQPKVSWSCDGVKISDSKILHIDQLTPENKGEYVCYAENFLGSIEQIFFLEILVPPKILGDTVEVFEVPQGNSFSVTCLTEGVPPPVTWWTIPNTLSTTENLKQKSLRFNDSNKSHNGTYLCTATNSQGSINKMIQILILERPKIINQIKDPIRIMESDQFQLVCEVLGYPRPTIFWYHNGEKLEENLNTEYSTQVSLGHLNTTQFSLTAKNVTQNHQGEYQCWAINKLGRESTKFYVQILIPPRLLESEYEPYMEYLEGLPVILDCTATGFPKPQVTWFKDNKTLNDEPDIKISPDNFYLTIDKIKLNFSGFYQCKVSNEIANVTRNFSIDVLSPPRIPRDVSDSKIRVNKGDNLNLYCNYEGNPSPDIVWLKGLSRVQDFDLTNNNKTLTLKNVSHWDSGSFSCLAINKAGASEITYNIEIQEPPYFLSPEPLSVEKNIKLHRGFVLRCDVAGTPKPKLTWMKNGENIENKIEGKSLLISTDKSHLQVTGAILSDAGLYACQAENSVGIIQRNFNISIEATGEWTGWTQWSSCSVSCGSGERFRSRSCDYGDLSLDNNLINDLSCMGTDVEKEACMMEPCPINGRWSEWQSWSPCSETCGPGIRTRMRYCNQPQPSYDGLPCSGPNSEQQSCNERDCPENGSWSGWSEWGLCSKSCGKGVRARYRSCDNPRPSYGGLNCKGTSVEVLNCNVQPCPVNGGWTNWEPWTPCSVTCGYGTKMRYRFCSNPAPQYGGKYCKGDNLMIDKCFVRSCKIKQKAAKLRVRGLLNDENIPENVIYANISSEGVANFIESNSKSIMKNQKGWFPYLTFLVSPVSWQLAQDDEDEDDEFRFTQKSKIAFATGQELFIQHVGQGVDQDGDLQVEIEMRGEVPIVQTDAQVSIQPYYENYIQTEEQAMTTQAHNKLFVNGKPLKYSWNNSIEYDQFKNTDRFFIEKFSMQNIDTQYDEERNEVKFSASSFVNKEKMENCPVGLMRDSKSHLCVDVNECQFPEKNLCHSTQNCENSYGSYTCSCQAGYKSIGIGSRCLDINECLMDAHQCSHDCENLPGTYECKCPKGMTLSSDLHTCLKIAKLMKRFDNKDMEYLNQNEYSFEDSYKTITYKTGCSEGYTRGPRGCEDYNECEFEEEICSEYESCLNTKGSYFCIPTPCPYNYKRDPSTSSCVQFCNPKTLCSEGAAVAQSVSYTTLSIAKRQIIPHEPLLLLQIYSVDGKPLAGASYILEDSTPGNSFMVINEENNGILSTFRIPEKDRVHRITIVGNSIDQKTHKLLYTTKFIIYLYVSD